MKKTTFVAGIVSLVGLGVSIFNINTVFAIYHTVVPTSSMVGQEIWLILALVVAHYLLLTVTSIAFIAKVIKRWNKIK